MEEKHKGESKALAGWLRGQLGKKLQTPIQTVFHLLILAVFLFASPQKYRQNKFVVFLARFYHPAVLLDRL